MNSRLYTGCLLVCFVVMGCSSEEHQLDPKTFPYTLEIVRELGENDHPFDLDGDGVDEIISNRINSRTSLTVSTPSSAILIRTHDEKVIEQVNFDGTILEPRVLDVDKDGTSEVVVPFTRNDSLFVSILSAQGEKRWQLFISQGAPRVEADTVIPWEPVMRDVQVFGSLPLDSLYLVSVVNTGLARFPRGVFVHRLSDGSLLGKSMIGATVHNHVFADINGDDSEELLINSWATNNGASLGGYDDNKSYIIAFDFLPAPEIIWSTQLGENWSKSDIGILDIDSNGEKELLSYMSSYANEASKSRLKLHQLQTWETYLQRDFNHPTLPPVFIDLDRDTRLEIVTATGLGQVMALNNAFEVIKQKDLGRRSGRLMVVPDMDNDGVSEIVMGSYQQIMLLDPNLNIKAIYPRGIQRGIAAGVFQGDRGEAPYLLVKEETRRVALALRPNTFFWYYKYDTFFFWTLILTSLAGGVCYIYSLRTRNRRLQEIHNLLIQQDSRAIFKMSLDKHILWTNDTFAAWFFEELQSTTSRLPSISTILNAHPALLRFLNELENNPVSSFPNHKKQNDMRLGNKLVAVTIDLIGSGKGNNAAWLIKMTKKEAFLPAEQAKVWTLMAERTVHDIKNPLTSILLTVQRLQDTYRQKAPDAVAHIDGYVERIIQQVEHLRARTRNFLKFVDLEAPDITRTDINTFLTEQSALLEKYLPEDITLHVKLEEGIPLIPIDREQMSSVIENLVSNAVNAMLSGGAITISNSVRAMQLSPMDERRSYLIVEIMDTGKGIAMDKKSNLFDVGQTTSENGTGLGLAIVKKIVDLHDGHLEIESEEGNGTVCSIYLPLPED